MKRIFLSLLMPLLAFSLLAQQEQRALYVFRNDGAFNAFLFESIDSITYSQRFSDYLIQIILYNFEYLKLFIHKGLFFHFIY